MSPLNSPKAGSPDRAGAFLDAGRIIEFAHAANSAKWPGAMELNYARQMNAFLLLLRRRAGKEGRIAGAVSGRQAEANWSIWAKRDRRRTPLERGTRGGKKNSC